MREPNLVPYARTHFSSGPGEASPRLSWHDNHCEKKRRDDAQDCSQPCMSPAVSLRSKDAECGGLEGTIVKTPTCVMPIASGQCASAGTPLEPPTPTCCPSLRHSAGRS